MKKNGIEPYFQDYLGSLCHERMVILLLVAAFLVPAFFYLDFYILSEKSTDILLTLGFIRGAFVLIVIASYLVFKGNKFSLNHVTTSGYLFSFFTSAVIIYTTILLGGFDSTYYAGLNLVVVGIGVLIPWKPAHTFISGVFIIALYISANLFFQSSFSSKNLINNLFFLCGMLVIAITISFNQYFLLRKEFYSKFQIKKVKQKLTGELKIAKNIQSSLLPKKAEVDGFEVLSYMKTCSDVGGDYFDIIKSTDKQYVLIGDVSGHGVTSGLISMMAQTAIHSLISSKNFKSIVDILTHANAILTKNIRHLKEEKFMTMKLLEVNQNGTIKYTGAHLPSLVYRSKSKEVEVLESYGFWLGMEENITEYFYIDETTLSPDDILLLYTDGLTEAFDSDNNMFGLKRLAGILRNNGEKKIEAIKSSILKDFSQFQLNDDLSFLILKKIKCAA